MADTNHGEAPAGPGGGPALTVRWISDERVELSYDARARVFERATRMDDVDVEYVVNPR